MTITWRHFGKLSQPQVQAQFPFLSARRAASCTRKKKKFPSPLDPTLYIGCVREFEPKGNSRPGSPFDSYRGRATRTLPSAEPARGPLRASFPASWLGWCAQPDNASPPVPACGGTSCLPATGAFPLPPAKSTGVSALQDTLQPRPCRRPESRKWNWAQETTNSLRNLRPVTELQFPL